MTRKKEGSKTGLGAVDRHRPGWSLCAGDDVEERRADREDQSRWKQTERVCALACRNSERMRRGVRKGVAGVEVGEQKNSSGMQRGRTQKRARTVKGY